MKKVVVFSFVFCMLVSACAPTVATTPVIQTPSLTPLPTRTLYFAWTRTFTPVPTQPLPLSPTFTPSLTFVPSVTSTQQPPLVEHQWQPEIALILVYETPGDGGGFIPYSIPPYFSLFADGRLFVIRRNEETWNFQVFTKQLNRQELCQHLNTLDQIGFLDYDSTTYRFSNGKSFGNGSSGIQIIVNAWKSHDYVYDGLNGYVEDWSNLESVNPNWRPVILPALRNAYNFFSFYPIENLEIYHPEQVVIRVAQLDQPNSDITSQAVEWPLADPSLANMFAEGGLSLPDFDQYLIIENPDATAVDNAIKHSYSDNAFFFEIIDGVKKYYSISYRPVLPYELPEERLAVIPAPDTKKPDFTLTCYPSDGILPIPTPPSQ